MIRHSVFQFSNSQDVVNIREVLLRNGYSEASVTDRLRLDVLGTPTPLDVLYGMDCTTELTPLDVLIRLFFLSATVKIEDAARVLGSDLVSASVDAGFLKEDGGTISCPVFVTPVYGLFLVCDRPDHTRVDQVMTIGTSTKSLASLTIRRHARLSLDLGCGSGILTFLAARHSDHAIGVDANARAVAMAEFGAQLNGLRNVEFIVGDWFEPVRDRRFNLIIANPPYVISPQNTFQYRDSGCSGDDLCRRLAGTVPEILAEDGFYHMNANWLVVRGQEWQDRLAGWVRGTGCDTWVLKQDMILPNRYAGGWVGDLQDAGERYTRWTEYYRSLDATAIGDGFITMRKRSKSENWFRVDDLPKGDRIAAGDAVLMGFLLRDYLDSAKDDESLLSARLRLSVNARVHQIYAQGGRQLAPVSAEITLSRGLPYRAGTDPLVIGLLARCDGSATVNELLAQLADASGAKLEAIMPSCLKMLRALIEHGFLLPESIAQPSNAAHA